MLISIYTGLPLFYVFVISLLILFYCLFNDFFVYVCLLCLLKYGAWYMRFLCMPFISLCPLSTQCRLAGGPAMQSQGTDFEENGDSPWWIFFYFYLWMPSGTAPHPENAMKVEWVDPSFFLWCWIYRVNFMFPYRISIWHIIMMMYRPFEPSFILTW